MKVGADTPMPLRDDIGEARPSAAAADGTSPGAAHRSVAIVSINYAPEVTGIGVYTAGLAEYLAARGYRVTVYTGFPYYPNWRKAESDRRRLFRHEMDAQVSVRRSYLYVPARPNVLQRILHELSFVISATLSYVLGPRADLTIIISPPLFLGLPIAGAARLKRSKTLFHVQDLQPDAAVDLGMLRHRGALSILYTLEKWTYRVVDRISAISDGMAKRIAGKGIPERKISLFRNWAHDYLVKPMPRSTRFRDEWKLGERHVVLYAGNMGVKQGLEMVIDAARLCRDQPDIVFLIVGDGGQKTELVERAERLGLDNVLFRPLQPADALSELLATADIAVVPQRAGVRDIVLPSKVANLMSAGRPVVVAAEPETDLYRLVRTAECGLTVAPGDGTALAEAIVSLRQSEEDRLRLGRSGRRYVEARLSREAVLGEFESWLDQWHRTHTRRQQEASQE